VVVQVEMIKQQVDLALVPMLVDKAKAIQVLVPVVVHPDLVEVVQMSRAIKVKSNDHVQMFFY
jgi:hypothetical protein